jgi:hypothetical protein
MRTIAVCLVLAITGCQPIAVGGHGGFYAAGPPPPPGGVHASASVSVEIQFFGIPLGGAQDVVFVLDKSGSMGLVSAGFAGSDVGMGEVKSALASIGGSLVNKAAGSPLPSKLEAAKSELIRTLHAMPDGTRFTIIFFDDEIAAWSPHMMILDPSTRGAATSFIRGIDDGGSTAAVPALRIAYAAGARRIILLSDGLANNGGDGDDLLAEARAAIAAGVRFDTVGIGLDQDAALLRTLAAESGGMAIMR